MGFKIRIGGYEVEADSATEAAQLLRELEASQPTQAMPPAPKKTQGNGSNPSVPRLKDTERDHAEAAIRFLGLLKDAPAGVNAEAVMPVLGATVPKGIGSRLASVNKVLDKLELKPRKVYQATRTRTGRIWRKKSQIVSAINALQQAVNR